MRSSSCLLLLLICFSISSTSLGQNIKVTLLGTGVPLPSIVRFGPATLVEANNQFFLFDCGRGASQRLWQQKIPLGKVNHLFLTHLHSDHTVGIPDFWLTGWLPTSFGQRSSPLLVWGPAETPGMMKGLQEAYSWDIRTRSHERNKVDSGIMVTTQVVKEGIVYDEDGVKITAFLVDHSDFIDSAFGYRVDYNGHSVVISGDTRYSENLIKFSNGTDVLVHEVAIAREDLAKKSSIVRQVLSYHTSPSQAGKLFSIVKPKMAVYTHIAMPLVDPSLPLPTIDDIIKETRKYYSGPLEVGEDLMTIEIGDKVEVKRFSR